jgi:hypothetical protein
MNDILSSLRWESTGGSIIVARPTPAFWDAWRANKQAIRDMGVSIEKSPETGSWMVLGDSEQLGIAASEPVAPVIDTSMKWSPEQEAIFAWFRAGKGNLIVQARAGTGKTTTIKAAFSHAPESRMLYAVFNKKNQLEAAAKISDGRVEIKTLHALGFQYIRAMWPNARPDDKVEFDRVDAALRQYRSVPDEVRAAVRKLAGLGKNCLCGVGTVEELINVAEEFDVDCEGFESPGCGGWTVARIAAAAQQVMKNSLVKDPQGRISFNDMVWLPIAANWVRSWFDMVVVDEAQDMNLPQLQMTVKACREGGRIVVVGDDRQAIYGFRGAVTEGMRMMQTTLNAAVLGLTVTYRCPRAVVARAQVFVPDYSAAPEAPEGEVRSLAAGAIITTAEVGDAILSRANAPLMPLCLGLLRRGTPARIEGRDIGKALLSIVDKLNARTVPQFLTKLQNWSDRRKNRFAKTENFEQKCIEIEDQRATLEAVADGSSSVDEIRSRLVTLFEDTKPGGRPCVVLSSVHKAKGLEWDRVILVHSTFMKAPRTGGSPGQQEVNIYYVAMTRAKKTLVLAE